MSNPARLLHELLITWTVPPSQAPETVRSNGDAGSLEFWQEQAQAVRFIRDIEVALDGMAAVGEDVEHYRDVIPALYQGVFAYTTPWKHGVNGATSPVDVRDMRLVRALASHLQSINYSPQIGGDQLAALLESLDRTEELIRTSSDIDDTIRRYLLGLVSEARRVASELQTFGDVELRSVTFELGAALLSTAGDQVPEANRQSWVDRAKSLVAKVGWKATDHALEAGSSAVFDAIGSGILG